MQLISHPWSAARTWLLCIALLGVLVPHLAHALHSPCWIYLPAHFAPLIAGLGLGWRAGGLVGLLVVGSDAIGGHLMPAQLLPIACELLTYGVVAGLLSLRSRNWASTLYYLVAAQLAGRLAYLLPALILGKPLLRSLRGLFVFPWPGLLLQLVLIPPLVLLISRRAHHLPPVRAPSAAS